MEVLTEMDEYFNAMSKINMDEPVMPYVKGRLVESDVYNKIQKILNTPELEKAHMYCYDLALENLDECDIKKINNLYRLGVDRGFIDDDFQYQDCSKPEDSTANCCEPKEPVVKMNPRAKIPCFIAMYSAMKDGQIKTGEAYSRAISVQAAKADVIAQLSKFGYTNISILAIEATEEDACSCAIGAGSSIGEDDMLDGRVHNNHLPEAEKAEDTAEDNGSADENTVEDTTTDDSSAEDDTAEDSEGGASSDDSSSDSNTNAKDADSTENADDSSTEDDATEDDDTEDDAAEDDVSSDEDSTGEDSEDDASSEDTEKEPEAEEKEELDDNKKADLKDNYKKIFKNTMLKCKFEDRSFDDLTLKEKVVFFTELSKMWKEDYEPSAFMSDKEIDQLNKIVVKK